MWSKAREIAEGDTVIVWMTREQLLPVVITAGAELNGRFGYYRHSELIGVPYGSKVASRNARGFIHILRPTPELWTRALPHRTQILYLADIAFVATWLNIRPGSVVIEAGTGSGSFSHSTARTIGPTGTLYSYEFHEGRAAKAKDDFTRHGMDNITLTHRNVCKEGFTIEGSADAVFLDLPAPWEAIEHAKKALKKDRVSRICCFSPCMEQVLRTVSALNGAGFSDVTMYESLLRPHEVVAIPPLPSIADISDKLKAQELRKEEKRQGQIATSKARNLARGDGKRKRDAEDVDGTNTIIEEAEVADVLEAKRVKTDDVNGEDAMPESGAATPAPAPEENASASTSANPPEKVKRWRNVPMGEARTVVSRPFPEVRGHTSYLTFATLVPHSVGSSSVASGAANTNDTQDAEERTGDVIEVVDNTSQMQLGED